MTDNLAEDLNVLHRSMRRCRLCVEGGYDITPGAIFAGSQKARFMLVGQAPGVTEVEAGRPFNAGSGTRLFQWLKLAGFEEALFRRDQYMTSVTKCFPGKAMSGGGDRVPSSAEQKLCRSFLDAEISIVNPEVILPVGRLAIDLFIPGKLPLSQVIGRPFRWDDRKVIPLPHPSGASRWHQIAENRDLINQSISLIREQRRRLGY